MIGIFSLDTCQPRNYDHQSDVGKPKVILPLDGEVWGGNVGGLGPQFQGQQLPRCAV